jgi:hypothetical protein
MKKVVFVFFFSSVWVLHAQHLHFVAGANAPTQNAKLIAVNSNDFVLDSGYVRTMTFRTNGPTVGLWEVSHPFIVAAATPPHGGPEPGAPALGSWIHMGMVSATGPAGAELGYWETNATSAPTIRLRIGETGTDLWPISGNKGAPGSDPYGHIHGRRFTATHPGLYVIAFRFVDLSTNGVNGGAIHAPSDLIYVYFQAGITLKSPRKNGNSFTVDVGTQIGRAFTLEYTSELGTGAMWTAGQSISGDDHFLVLTDSDATGEHRFYRVRHEPEQ